MPLHNAYELGRTDIVQLLLTSGANTNIDNRNGDTPLSIALAIDHHDIVQLFFFPGPDA